MAGRPLDGPLHRVVGDMAGPSATPLAPPSSAESTVEAVPQPSDASEVWLSQSVRHWAARALETARGEWRIAIDSVLEDLEDISRTRTTGAIDDTDEATRVDDLRTPCAARGRGGPVPVCP